ncbi:carcinoembryonic antigen-related cell adhesion molecule 1-like [Rana temporaria]|uniref:carcinoembryonic antigen-related cell adhesion molecule 1-like n=1 Tax=Rana temporaria TaxID=8407 RepID=UPI001AADD4AE|nr:carcinoembryonic antigen-related cell adhesion molecule 1-like [Rana temporaria]
MDTMIFQWALVFSGLLTSFAQISAPIGGSGYLYATGISITPQHQKSWTIDGVPTIIADLLPGGNPVYLGRCAGNECELYENGTLRIDQLISSDNTSYTLTIRLGGVTSSEQVRLNVYDPLTPPTIHASSSIRPVNGTTLSLTCNAGSQVVHKIYFYQNEHVVNCNLPHLSCNDSILTFNPILDIDTGYYTCVIQNPVSQNSSTSLFLNVAVNVSEVTISNNATRPITVDKDSVALKCSSYGTDVSYKWTFLGSPLPQNPRYHLTDNHSTLIISPVTRNEQGPFVCEVGNYLNNGTSDPYNLTWLPNGQITCDAQRSGQSIQLFCSWPGGYPPAQVHMMYQSVNLTKLDEVMTEIPFGQFPLGTPLSCSGTHQGSNETCSVLIDTPQYPGFNDSTRFVRKGNSVFFPVTLSSAKSAQIFPSKFSWFQMEPTQTELSTGEDFSIVSNDYSSILIVHAISEELAGSYMCEAENAIGTNSFRFNVEVELEEVITDEDILSTGAIAGIVIGSLAVLALIALTVVLIIRKKDTTPKTKSVTTHVHHTNNAYVPEPSQVIQQSRGEVGLPDMWTYYRAVHFTKIVDWHCHGAEKQWVAMELENSKDTAKSWPSVTPH